jgi:hypothetical protein
VTVCIAALSDERFVVIASDRMLTGGRRFEPDQGKFQFNPDLRGIAILYAGRARPHSTAMARFERLVAERTKAEPPKLWTVEEVALEYAECLRWVWRYRAERAVLAKHDLTWDEWRRPAKDIRPEIIERLDRRLRQFDIGVEVIVAGVNPNGLPSIWFATHEGASSCDSVGFAAIGSGSDYACVQLMDAAHTRFNPLAETIVLVHAAKRAAEADPDVGPITDMKILAHSIRAVKDLAPERGRPNKLLPGVWNVTGPLQSILARGDPLRDNALNETRQQMAKEIQVALAQFFSWQREDESKEAQENG